MITTIAAGHYRVTGSTHHEIDEGIHTALQAAQEYSTTGSRQGIVITRHAPDSYTVALSQDVPYGLTVEAKEPDLHQEVHAPEHGSGDGHKRGTGIPLFEPPQINTSVPKVGQRKS